MPDLEGYEPNAADHAIHRAPWKETRMAVQSVVCYSLSGDRPQPHIDVVGDFIVRCLRMVWLP